MEMDTTLRLIIIPLLLSVTTGSSNHGSYLITVPKDLLPGFTLDVNVIIFNSNGDVNLDASLINATSGAVIIHANDAFRTGPSKDLKIQLPWELPFGTYKLTLRATGGLSFIKDTTFHHQERRVITLIQTDKAIYSDGQRVQFRIVALYPDLKPYEGPLDIEIYDGKNTLSQSWSGINGKLGIISKFYELGPNPVFGEWSIKTRVKQTYVEMKSFKVHKYVLPKFDVTIKTVSQYMLSNGGPITVNVSARYSYEKNVRGTLKFQVQSNSGTVLMEKLANIYGSVIYTVPQSTIYGQQQGIVIIAQVGESTTGTTVTTEKSIEFISPSQLSIALRPNLDKFAPGLPYVTFVKIKNGTKLYKNLDSTLRLDVTYTKHVKQICRYTSAPYINIISDTVNQHNIQVRSGYAKIELNPDVNTVTIDLTISLNSVTQRFQLTSKDSKSGKYIKIIPHNPALEVDNTTQIEVVSNFDIYRPIYYQIFSRGGISIQNHKFSCIGQKCLSSNFQVKPQFFPRSSIAVYYVTDESEILSDEIIIDVTHFHLGMVSLKFSKQQVLPGEPVNLVVGAVANSTVCLMVDDASVFMLQSGFDIQEEEVESNIYSLTGYSSNLQSENLNSYNFQFSSAGFGSGWNSAIHLYRAFDKNIGVTALTDYYPSYATNSRLPTECNICSTNPCGVGGYCILQGSYYTCNCYVHYSGRNCERYYNPHHYEVIPDVLNSRKYNIMIVI